MEGHSAGLDDVPNLTVRDVAARIGLSYHAVLRAAHRGEVTAYKVCGRVLFRKADVLAWIAACRLELEEQSAPQPPPSVPGSRENLREIERRHFEHRGPRA